MDATPLDRRKFYFDFKWFLIFAIVAFLIIFEVFPLLYLVFRSFFPSGSFSLEAFKRVYTYELNWTALKNTLITASASLVFGVLIAFPLAWLRLLNPSVGTLNKFLADLFHLSSMPFNIYSVGGLIWVLTTFYYPYAFITISRAMEKMDPSLEEAALISGASWLRSFKDITIPLIAPSVVAGWFLIFMPCFYELTMSTLLYSTNTKTLGFELYQYQTYHSQQTASAMAAAILIFVVVVNWILNKLTDGKFSI